MRTWQQWLTTALLGAVIALNITGWRTGWWSTLCNNTKRFIPAWAFCVGWGALTRWLIPHYCRQTTGEGNPSWRSRKHHAPSV